MLTNNPYEAVLENGLPGVDFFVYCILPFPIIGVVLVVGMLKSTFATIVSAVRPVQFKTMPCNNSYDLSDTRRRPK